MTELTLISDTVRIYQRGSTNMERKFGNEFKHIAVKGYRNINELYEQDSQLHACETLFGDWNAEVMLLAQDAANFKLFEEFLISKRQENPYHHDATNSTNKNLFNVLSSLKIFELGTYENPNNRNCGIYYANAIWLLKDSNSMSSPIINKKEIYERSKEVFFTTIQNLEKLKTIVTLGKHSFEFIKYCFPNQIAVHWPDNVTNRKKYNVSNNNKQIQIASIFHTSVRGMVARARIESLPASVANGIEATQKDLRIIFDI